MKQLVQGKGEGLVGQFVRYTLASGIALTLDFGAFFALKHLGLHVYVANGIAVTLGALLGYWICITWVFAGRRHDSHAVSFGGFVVIGLIGLGVNQLVFWLTRSVVDLPALLDLTFEGDAGDVLCKGVAAVVSFAWNFSARKLILFR
jgi:putative flippase GtrA